MLGDVFRLDQDNLVTVVHDERTRVRNRIADRFSNHLFGTVGQKRIGFGPALAPNEIDVDNQDFDQRHVTTPSDITHTLYRILLYQIFH